MIFDFRCMKCNRVETDVFMTFEHAPGDHPMCCGENMRKHFTSVPMVHWKDYDLPDGGFKAAHDGTHITSRKQNLEYMKRHGLQDANEVYEKPTYASEQAERAQSQAAIDQITPSDDMMDRMASDGTLAQIEEMID